METLQVLEQRITQLIALVHKLQEDNAVVTKECYQALEKLEALENSKLHDARSLEALSNERECTLRALDALINDIDKLVGKEQQL